MSQNQQPNVLPDTDPVGVVGSGNSTASFTINILEDAISQSLEGKLYVLSHEEGNITKYVVGQMTGLEGTNEWHEKTALQPLIKREGSLPDLSGDTDVKAATLTLIGAYEYDAISDEFVTTTLNTPPASGTEIYEVNNDLMDEIATDNRYNIGRIYRSDTLAPLELKGFGSVAQGGHGEGRRTGVFGRSGTGKSIVAAELLGGYAKDEDMGILLLDPEGEYADDSFGDANFEFSFHDLLDAARGQDNYTIRDIGNVTLRDRQSFLRLLDEADVFKKLGVFDGEKREMVIDDLFDCYDQDSVDPGDVGIADFVDDVAGLADLAYASNKADDVQDRYSSQNNLIEYRFETVQDLFDEGPQDITVDQLIDEVLTKGEIVVLNLDPDNIDAANIGGKSALYTILHGIMIRFRSRVYRNFRDDELANALVALDEAQEFMPRRTPDNEFLGELRQQIRRSQLKSRKRGVGWLFINQRISTFDETAYTQMDNRIFCAGLDIGDDGRAVRQVVQKDAYKEYKKLPAPKQSNIYTYMVTGGIVSLGTTGRPLIVEGFDGSDEVIDAN